MGLTLPHLFTDLNDNTNNDLDFVDRFFEIHNLLKVALIFFQQLNPSLMPGTAAYNTIMAQGLFAMVTSPEGFGINQEESANQTARPALQVFLERDQNGADCGNLNNFYRGILLLAGISSTNLDVMIDNQNRDFRQENIRHECVAVFPDPANTSEFIQADIRYDFFGGTNQHQEVRILHPHEIISHYHHDQTINLPRNEAIAELNQSLLYDPDNIAAIFNLGLLFLWQANQTSAQLEIAKSYFNQVLWLYPEHTPTQTQLSLLFSLEQDTVVQ